MLASHSGVTTRVRGMAWRIASLVLAAIALATLLCERGRIPQDPNYFLFADARKLLRIPNIFNVLSNLGFAIVGVFGVAFARRARTPMLDERERPPWVVFFGAVAMTSIGSGWFHLAPSIDSLVWDRLPMAVGFMALLAALVAERIDASAGARLLGPLTVAGIASVLHWWWTEHAGAGDLRAYLFVQFYPLVAVPLVLVLFPARYSGGGSWIVALACYALAKVAESADATVFGWGRVVSGHTVKHLLAAAGIAVLARMVASRRPLAGATRSGRGV